MAGWRAVDGQFVINVIANRNCPFRSIYLYINKYPPITVISPPINVTPNPPSSPRLAVGTYVTQHLHLTATKQTLYNGTTGWALIRFRIPYESTPCCCFSAINHHHNTIHYEHLEHHHLRRHTPILHPITTESRPLLACSSLMIAGATWFIRGWWYLSIHHLLVLPSSLYSPRATFDGTIQWNFCKYSHTERNNRVLRPIHG